MGLLSAAQILMYINFVNNTALVTSFVLHAVAVLGFIDGISGIIPRY